MEKESLRIKSVCVHEGQFWTVPLHTDALYRIDPVRRERVCVCHLGYENQEVWYFICSDKDKIWGISEQRKPLRIFSYDLNEKKLETYENEKVESRIFLSEIREGIIYSFFEDSARGCLCFDTEKKEFYMEQAWKDALKSRGVNGSLGSYFHEGEDIFFTLRDTSQLLHYNFGTKELQLIDAGEKLRGIVVKDTVYYCITAQEGAVLYFDPAVGNSSKRYGTMEDMRSYVRIFKLGNQFLLLGEKELDYFDEEGEIRRCEISEEMVRKYRGPLYAVNSCLDGVNYLFPYGADKLLAFEEDGSLRASYALDFTEEEIRKSNLHKLFLQGVVEEGKEICAETMMEYLAMQEPRVTDGEELPITF